MGLEFNDNGNIRTLTVADMATSDFQEAYSDLYKGLYGFRPRGHDVATMLHFFDTYEAEFAFAQEREEAALAYRLGYLEHKHGRKFADNREAERFNEQAAYNRFMDALHAEEEAKAEAAEFVRRGSAMPVIEAYMHGDFKGCYA